MKLEKLGPVRACEFGSVGLKGFSTQGRCSWKELRRPRFSRTLRSSMQERHLGIMSVQLAFQPLLLVLRRVFSFVRNDARGGGRKPGFSGYPPGLFAGVNGFLFALFHPGPEPGF